MIQRGYGKLVDILIGCECVLGTQSSPTLYDSMDCGPEFLCAWDSPGESAGVGCISFGPVDGEVNGSQHHQPSGFHLNKSVVYCMLITHNYLLPPRGDLIICITAQRYGYACPLKPGPFVKAALLFLGSFPLSLHLPPSLISNCLNLPFGRKEGHGD